MICPIHLICVCVRGVRASPLGSRNDSFVPLYYYASRNVCVCVRISLNYSYVYINWSSHTPNKKKYVTKSGGHDDEDDAPLSLENKIKSDSVDDAGVVFCSKTKTKISIKSIPHAHTHSQKKKIIILLIIIILT